MPPVLELGIVKQVAGVVHHTSRNPGLLQRRHKRLGVPTPSPCGHQAVELIFLCLATQNTGEVLLMGPTVSCRRDHLAQGVPRLVGEAGNGNPALLALTWIDPMRGGAGVSIASTTRLDAVDGVDVIRSEVSGGKSGAEYNLSSSQVANSMIISAPLARVVSLICNPHPKTAWPWTHRASLDDHARRTRLQYRHEGSGYA